MWENREFRIRIEEDTLADYEKVMLTSGECSFFMPMSFVGENGSEVACYDCSGFAPLSTYRIDKTEDALYIIECVLLILGKSVEYLITPSKITINTDTVFYNKESGEVKIAYIPQKKEGMSLRKNIVSFIGQLKNDVHDGYEKYLVEAARVILYKNYFVREMVNKVGMFKRQLYAQQNRLQGNEGKAEIK